MGFQGDTVVQKTRLPKLETEEMLQSTGLQRVRHNSAQTAGKKIGIKKDTSKGRTAALKARKGAGGWREDWTLCQRP